MNALLGSVAAETRAVLHSLADAPLSSAIVREQWKYTPVARSLALFTGEQATAGTGLEGSDQPGITLATGVIPDAPALEALVRCASVCPPSARALLLADSVDRLVISGTVAKPVRILQTDARRPLLIELAPGSRATLEDTADRSSTGWIHIIAGPGSDLDYSRLRETRDTSDWQRLVISLGPDSTLRLNHYATGALLRRLDALIELRGAGAQLDLAGCWSATGQEKLDQQWHVEHLAPDTTSRQVHHGIGDGNSTTTFRGRIFIGADCRRANADLINRNLALSAGTTCNTKPELEIHNDDVRCSHGATVGQLAEDSVFYLRSRGFDLDTARRVLATGFLRRGIRGSLESRARRALTGADDD